MLPNAMHFQEAGRWYSYVVGVDLGEAVDYSAIAAIEHPAWLAGYASIEPRYVTRLGLTELAGRKEEWIWPGEVSTDAFLTLRAFNLKDGMPEEVPLRLSHLDRVPLGTPYPEVARRVEELIRGTPRLQIRPTALVVDHVGVGAAVVDQLRALDLAPIPVFSTAGRDVKAREGGGFNVPKKDLVDAARMALQAGRLKVSPRLEHGEALRRELADYRVRQSPTTGHESFEAIRQGGAHDDLVSSVMHAVWFCDYWHGRITRR